MKVFSTVVHLIKQESEVNIFKEFLKVWFSEFSGYSKYLDHNLFALPVLTPALSIINWAKEKIESIDKKTEKLQNMTSNLSWNSDIEQLYTLRREGDRSLKW